MHSRSMSDTLALGTITMLSLSMLGSSYVLWHRLRGRTATQAPLDAWSLERLTGFALGLLGAAVFTWLLMCVVLAVLAHLLALVGDRRAATIASLIPGFVARLVIAGLGGSLAVAGCGFGAAPAGAAVSALAPLAPKKLAANPEVGPSRSGALHRSDLGSEPIEGKPELLSPGFIPHRIPLPLPRLVGATTRPSSEVVVRQGDSLWAIAARYLPADAGVGEIASAWPHWYEANRKIIGQDPDLLEVGMVLQRPEFSLPKP